MFFIVRGFSRKCGYPWQISKSASLLCIKHHRIRDFRPHAAHSAFREIQLSCYHGQVLLENKFSYQRKRNYAQCGSEKEKPTYYSEQMKWSPIFPNNKEKIEYAMKLAKFRLTGLVVLTTLAGYIIAPGSFQFSSCCATIVGTALCSSSANTFNQFLEVPYDSQMSRTRNRILVQGLLRPLNAVVFGSMSGIAGVSLLYAAVNPITSLLGFLNIFLYAAVYTPAKRLSIVNTWIGSLVGAIPPVMGWTACTGSLGLGSLALALVLYCWQFPHFNSLSWSYRPDYSRAGYRMMAVTDPALCRRVTLRHSMAQIPLAFLFPLLDVTNWWFVAESLPLNIYFAYLSYRFYTSSDNKTARQLFRFSLLNLPLLVLLMVINRKKTEEEENGKTFHCTQWFSCI